MAREPQSNKAAPPTEEPAGASVEESNAQEVYRLIDPAGRKYATSVKAEAENRIRTQGYKLDN